MAKQMTNSTTDFGPVHPLQPAPGGHQDNTAPSLLTTVGNSIRSSIMSATGADKVVKGLSK